MSYSQVKAKLEGETERERGGVYENPNELAGSTSDRRNPASYEFPGNMVDVPVYATVDDSTAN